MFEALQARRGLADGPSWILDQVFPAGRAAPMVTVLDGHPHTLAFLTGINHVSASCALGVSRFGQVGSLDDVYRYHGIDTDEYVTQDPVAGIRNYNMSASPLNYSSVDYDFVGLQVHAVRRGLERKQLRHPGRDDRQVRRGERSPAEVLRQRVDASDPVPR